VLWLLHGCSGAQCQDRGELENVYNVRNQRLEKIKKKKEMTLALL